MSAKDTTYQKAGVDISAADNWVTLLQTLGVAGVPEALKNRVVSGIGDYASVFKLSDSHWVATSTDGVGTKLLWTQAGLGSPEALAQDLLAMNANDLLCVGARPTLFLDYLAVGSKDMLKQGGMLARFISGLNQACHSTGQLLVGGETAQMPDLYGQHGFDLAGFSVGFLSPEEHLRVDLIEEGSELWAWTSSGPHSNGFSLLRKLFAEKTDNAFIEKEFMVPTRLYVNEFLALREGLKKAGLEKGLQAAFHITGSGFLNLVRAQPKNRTVGFEITGWAEKDWPSWAQAVAKRSGLSKAELYATFNMGLGFVLVLDAKIAGRARTLLSSCALRLIGKVLSDSVVKMDGVVLE